MAIKDQCIGCKKHNVDSDFCSEHKLCPIYDGKSCQQYEKRGINIAKGNNSSTIGNGSSNGYQQPSQPLPSSPSQDTSWFKRLFSFDGRIRRTEYCITYILMQLYALPMNILSEDEISGGFAIIWLLLLVPVLWITYAQGAKRCHDRGNSGWYQLIPFYVFWMLFAEGDHGRNQYGEDPKA